MEFIREKIKEKPLNKKRIAIQVGIAALCGLVFALCGCIVVLIFAPQIKDALAENPQNTMESELDSESEVSESDTQGIVVVPPPVVPDISLSISDYQELKSQLYAIGNEANKSIVTVTGMKSEMDWMNNAYETLGQGSGVILSTDNNYLYILTEMKNISDAKNINVTFVDEARAEATLLKTDANTGLTILTVEKSKLEKATHSAIKVAKIGNSRIVKNGSIVIALGSPLGASGSILTGNITSTENEINTKDVNYSVFTTDIVANENGSGILINTSGEIVGVVIQDFSGSQDSSTLTAVAIAEISGLLDTLVDGKDNPYIGLYVSTVTDDISKTYDIPKGVFIREVITDSPAMLAGLQSGDVIVKMNGEEITNDYLYSSKLSALIPGTKCDIVVKRQNGADYYEITCTVEIGVLQ